MVKVIIKEEAEEVLIIIEVVIKEDKVEGNNRDNKGIKTTIVNSNKIHNLSLKKKRKKLI